MNRLSTALLACAAACGNSHETHPDSFIPPAPDAAPDSYTPGPNVVEMNVYGTTPMLMQYRDGTGPWLTATADDTGAYELHITKDYIALAVCISTSDTAGFDAEEQAATFADGTQVAMFCNGDDSSTVGPQNMLTGTMAQPGSLTAENTTVTGTTAGWAYDVQVDPGTWDVIGLDATHILIDRAVDLNANKVLGAIDVDANGSALVKQTLDLTGTIAGETLSTDVYLFSSGGSFAPLVTNGGLDIVAPPGALLTAQDELELEAESYPADFSNYRSINVYGWDGTTVDYALPLKLTGVTVAEDAGTAKATFSAPPADTTQVFFGLYTQNSQTQEIAASAAWIADHGAGLEFDASSPDYQSGWKIDPTAAEYGFTIEGSAGGISTSSGVSGALGVGAVRRAFPQPHRIDARYRATHAIK